MSLMDHQQRGFDMSMQGIFEALLGRDDGLCCGGRRNTKPAKDCRAWRTHASQRGHSGYVLRISFEDYFTHVVCTRSSRAFATEPSFRTQSELSAQPSRPKSSRSFLIPLLTATFLYTPASAAPAPAHTAAFHVRQSIPDQAGRTGNDPAPVKPDVPPRPLPLSSSTPIALPNNSSTPVAQNHAPRLLQPLSPLRRRHRRPGVTNPAFPQHSPARFLPLPRASQNRRGASVRGRRRM